MKSRARRVMIVTTAVVAVLVCVTLAVYSDYYIQLYYVRKLEYDAKYLWQIIDQPNTNQDAAIRLFCAKYGEHIACAIWGDFENALRDALGIPVSLPEESREMTNEAAITGGVLGLCKDESSGYSWKWFWDLRWRGNGPPHFPVVSYALEAKPRIWKLLPYMEGREVSCQNRPSVTLQATKVAEAFARLPPGIVGDWIIQQNPDAYAIVIRAEASESPTIMPPERLPAPALRVLEER